MAMKPKRFILILVVAIGAAAGGAAMDRAILKGDRAASKQPVPVTKNRQPDYRDLLFNTSIGALQDLRTQDRFSPDQIETFKRMVLDRADIASTLPPGDEGLRLLIDASGYFAVDDAFDLWRLAKSAASSLAEEGTTRSPAACLNDAILVARKLAPSPPPKQFQLHSINSVLMLTRRVHREDGTSDEQIIEIAANQLKRTGHYIRKD